MPMPGAMMPGGPGGGGGGMPPGSPGDNSGMGGLGQDPNSAAALSAMDLLSPKQANPTAALQQVEEALKLAHQLVVSSIPQISQWAPKSAKDLHSAGRAIIQVLEELHVDQPLMPPPDLMLGMQPGPGAASQMGGGGMGGGAAGFGSPA